MTSEVTDYEVVNAMSIYGGSFARAIAEAAQRADRDNLSRLKAAFPDLWDEYREMALSRRTIAEGRL